MSGSVNKVMLIGRLGHDPEVRPMNSGGSVATLSLATSEKWRDQNQELQERTEWHRVVIFGKIADIVASYLKKGSQIYIEGRLQTRKWQDQEGKDRYSTEIVVSSYNGQMIMLSDSGNQSGSNHNKSNYDKQIYHSVSDKVSVSSEFDNDEIPF